MRHGVSSRIHRLFWQAALLALIAFITFAALDKPASLWFEGVKNESVAFFEQAGSGGEEPLSETVLGNENRREASLTAPFKQAYSHRHDLALPEIRKTPSTGPPSMGSLRNAPVGLRASHQTWRTL
jgi:hypothetical protein